MRSVRDLKQIVTIVRSESKRKGIAGRAEDLLDVSSETALGSTLNKYTTSVTPMKGYTDKLLTADVYGLECRDTSLKREFDRLVKDH